MSLRVISRIIAYTEATPSRLLSRRRRRHRWQRRRAVPAGAHASPVAVLVGRRTVARCLGSVARCRPKADVAVLRARVRRRSRLGGGGRLQIPLAFVGVFGVVVRVVVVESSCEIEKRTAGGGVAIAVWRRAERSVHWGRRRRGTTRR